MKARLLVVGVLLGVISGCASIHSTSISYIDSGAGRRIKAQDSGHGVFMVSIPQLDAAAHLKAQCAGTVNGVQVTTWMRNWLIIQHYHQEAVAWCKTN